MFLRYNLVSISIGDVFFSLYDATIIDSDVQKINVFLVIGVPRLMLLTYLATTEQEGQTFCLICIVKFQKMIENEKVLIPDIAKLNASFIDL